MSETQAERDRRLGASELELSKRLVRESEGLLVLAQEAGRIGIFELQVQAATMDVSPSFLSLYDLDTFDGRYESWLKCIFREDQIRVADLLQNAFTARARDFYGEFRVASPKDGSLKWMEVRSLVFYDSDRRPSRVVASMSM